MTVTYPETDPLRWKVFLGLFSGLRFTGMTNTSQNMTDARITSEMMTQLFGFPSEDPNKRECMGDDIYKQTHSFLCAAASVLYLIASGRKLNKFKQLIMKGITFS